MSTVALRGARERVDRGCDKDDLKKAKEVITNFMKSNANVRGVRKIAAMIEKNDFSAAALRGGCEEAAAGCEEERQGPELGHRQGVEALQAGLG